MNRLILLIVLLCWLPFAEAQRGISPRLAQRLFVIMDLAADNPERALQDLQSVLDNRRMTPLDKGYVAYERAALLVQQDQLALARTELESYLDNDEVTFIPRLRLLLAQLLLMDNEPEPALEQLEIWLNDAEEPRPSEFSLVGYTYLQLERYTEAADMLERAINSSENPQPQWSELLAFAYTRIGRTDEAISLLETIITEQPAEARWWRQLASVYLLIEDIPKGTAGLVVAGQIEGMDYEDQRRLAGLFTTLNMPADAAVVFSQAIDQRRQTEPQWESFEDQMLLGEMWMLARELETAVVSFQRAAEIEKSGEPGLKIAQLYLQWERYEEARDALREAIAAYGESAPSQANYLLAITEINLGNLQEASDVLMRLRDDPEYAERAQRLDDFVANSLSLQ
ncbi:MAG: tetratricopeptide repeat protein [Gammaproteobacteria bacterium]|nr:tetratricopeptide repeat protein [Gammaproteobacteria bacterium]